MTASLPTGWRGRGLAIGLLLVVLAVIYAAVIVPLLEFYADREALIDRQRTLVEKQTALAEQLPALKTRAAELRNAAKNDKTLLDGDNDAIAAAALQGKIEELASAGGITIGSTESLPSQPQGPYRRIGVRLALSAPYAGLIKLLAGIEAVKPPLIVDNLQIHTVTRQVSPANAEVTEASIEIFGLRGDTTTDLAAKR